MKYYTLEIRLVKEYADRGEHLRSGRVPVLPFDEACARRYGYLRARLEKEGQKLPDMDLQIASIALEWNSPLASHNQSHFGRLVETEGLKLEDWLTE